jgi:hypothetical protein
LHRSIAVAIGLGVPVAVYLINGTVEPSAIVLGAVMGFTYWYWGPAFPPA